MDFLKKFDFKWPNILKIAGLSLAAIILLAITIRLIGSSFYSISSIVNQGKVGSISSQGMVSLGYGGGVASEAKYDEAGTVSLSARNISLAPSSIMPPYNGGTTGDTAEQFEVTQYNATIETRQLDKTCAVMADLKPLPYVIFENASQYDYGCSYTFKVKRDKTAEILAKVKALNPKELSESAYTIKGLVDDFTSEVEILKNKLTSIDETLKKAVSAYDDITALATRVQDVESLAKIIDSKINIIERLTQERLNVNTQLDRIGRQKAEQLDRLEYTYFYVNIFENKFIDKDSLKDTWKAAIKKFVNDVNRVAQDITVNLVTFLLFVLLYAIYILIILVIAKYGWQLVKYIWKK